MFENCESLTLLPDISNWNKNKNINDKNNFILNCKSLEKLPDLSNLFNEEELRDNYIFEGCIKLEEKIKDNNKEVLKLLFDCLIYILKNLIYFCEKISTCLKLGYNCYRTVVYILCAISILWLVFIHLYNSFFLDESNEFINNPVTYLMNHTNISYIIEVKNITIITDIKRISENKEEFINKEMNFTFINSNITFEASQRNIKEFSIIISIIFFINILIIFLIFVFKSLQIIPFIFIIITDILAVVIGKKYLIIINNFSNSFKIYNNKLKKLFKRQFGKNIMDEYNSLNLSVISIKLNISIILLFILYLIMMCCAKIKGKRSYKNYLFEKNKIIINSNINNQL